MLFYILFYVQQKHTLVTVIRVIDLYLHADQSLEIKVGHTPNGRSVRKKIDFRRFV